MGKILVETRVSKVNKFSCIPKYVSFNRLSFQHICLIHFIFSLTYMFYIYIYIYREREGGEREMQRKRTKEGEERLNK